MDRLHDILENHEQNCVQGKRKYNPQYIKKLYLFIHPFNFLFIHLLIFIRRFGLPLWI